MLFTNYTQIIENGETPSLQKKRKDVLEILTAAVSAVNPYSVVARVFKENMLVLGKEHLDLSHFNNIDIVGFGKASTGMAQAVVDRVPIRRGIVVTNDLCARVQGKQVKVFVGGHPIPDERSVQVADRILHLVDQCEEHDLLLVLISGGGSSLFCKPRVSLQALQLTTQLLLRSGATIQEMNTVRKHLSLVSGGQLVSHAKCAVVSLIISDVVGDQLEFIASGPTCPDSTTYADGKKVLERYHLWKQVPSEVRTIIARGMNGFDPETPKHDNPIFKRVTNCIVAQNEMACRNAQDAANKLGYHAQVLSLMTTGEVQAAGKKLIDQARLSEKQGKNIIFIAGGETTVTVHGKGIGGRNQEMVLGCLEALSGTEMVFASLATDGIDGNSPGAGAIADGFSLSRALKNGLSLARFLEENNSYNFFTALDDALMTGPTGTNVMDIQVLVL